MFVKGEKEFFPVFVNNSYLKLLEDYFVKFLNILVFMLEHKLWDRDCMHISFLYIYLSIHFKCIVFYEQDEISLEISNYCKIIRPIFLHNNVISLHAIFFHKIDVMAFLSRNLVDCHHRITSALVIWNREGKWIYIYIQLRIKWSMRQIF